MSTGAKSIPRIQVFRPTMEEFKNFSKYIEKIESEGAHKAGLAKIIPPEGWTPRKNGYDDVDIVIPAPITQMVRGSQGLFQQINIQRKAMTVKSFKAMAESSKYCTPQHFDYEDLERKYWKNIAYNSPIYGADVSGSLYDKGIEEFNIQHLNTILDLVKEDYEIQIEGVNTAYLYFGMWKTTFAWHTEDMDLYSINYLHYGAPKSWYVVPPEHGRRLERLAANFFHSSSTECAAFLRHKMTIISPQVLKQYSIPFNKITQEPGEFMITFPFGYHSGFNHGYNCAESTNFALPRWVEYGKRASSCTCRNDCVKICMEMFVRKFQPDRYELWKLGKDYGSHPEDPSRHYAAPPPKKLDLALAAQREEKKKAKVDASQKIKRHPISKPDKDKPQSIIKDDVDDSDTKETEIYDVNEVSECNDSLCDDEVDYDRGSKEPADNDQFAAIDSGKDLLPGDEAPLYKSSKLKVTKKRTIDKKSKPPKKLKKLSDVSKPKESKKKSISKLEKKVTKKSAGAGSIPKTPIKDSEGPPPLIDYSDYVHKQQSLLSNTSQQADKTLVQAPPKMPAEAASQSTKLFILSNSGSSQAIVLNKDLIHNYPHIGRSVMNGAISMTPVSSSSLPITQKTNLVNVVSSSSPAKATIPNNPLIISKPPINIPAAAMNLANFVLKHQPANWTCEKTQGLKLKLVYPKQMVSQVSPVGMNTGCANSNFNTNETANSQPPSLTPIKMQIVSPDALLPSASSTATSSSEMHLDPPLLEPPIPISSNNAEVPSALTHEDKVKHKKHKKESHHRNVKIPPESLVKWALPILPLWQHQPFDFEEEKRFNIHCSARDPYCAICMIFSPINIAGSYPSPSAAIPPSSKVKMPTFCFGASLDNNCILDGNPLYSREGTSPLLTCIVCKLTVHATCYGVTMVQIGAWTCTRCSAPTQKIECCLCALRGGALKPTNDGRWAHIICTILIPEACFEDMLHKEPINVSHLGPTRIRLRCKYCIKPESNNSRACIQCLSGKCYLPFHVTCGFMAGVLFEVNDWPEPLTIICTKHSGGRRKPVKRNFTKVNIGDKVFAKHKNKRYYSVNVKDIYNQEYYSVLFDDNSTSINTMPEDIVHRQSTKDGCPDINEKIKVKWNDGLIYNAIFKGSRLCEIYIVEFEDGSIFTLERPQIYAMDETLPTDVRSKISQSSERQHIDDFKSMQGKRPRVANSKYYEEV